MGLYTTGGYINTPTVVTGTTHTLALNESELQFNLGAACAITLPAISGFPVGWTCKVRDIAHNVASNNATFNRSGSDTFTSGATSWIFGTNSATAELVVVDVSGTKKWYHS